MWWLLMCQVNIHMFSLQGFTLTVKRYYVLICRVKTILQGETKAKLPSTALLVTFFFHFFFFPVENQSAQMGRNPTWTQIMGEATKGNGKKGSWWERVMGRSRANTTAMPRLVEQGEKDSGYIWSHRYEEHFASENYKNKMSDVNVDIMRLMFRSWQLRNQHQPTFRLHLQFDFSLQQLCW